MTFPSTLDRPHARPKYEVIIDYTAKKADELSISVGEFVRLKVKPKDNNRKRASWYEVEKETAESGMQIAT